jgi:alanine dehydrogenase
VPARRPDAGRRRMTPILDEQDVEAVLDMGSCLDAVRGAFHDLGTGEAVNRPRTHAYTRLEDGSFYNLKSMDGGSPRIGLHAIRVCSEVAVERQVGGVWREQKVGRAEGGRFVGLVLLFDLTTTELVAIIHDAGLQRMRVGATSAVAAEQLSRPDSTRVGMFGAGWQAWPQLEALALVRPIEQVVVMSVRRQQTERFAREAQRRLGVPVVVAGSAREVVEGADIVVCATSSMEPVFDGDWLTPGQHVNSLQGSELDDTTHGRADVVCVRTRERPRHYRREVDDWYRYASDHRRERIPETTHVCTLGELVAGIDAGRRDPSEITLFGGSGTGPSSGLGIQFAAVGRSVLDRCRDLGRGRTIPSDWFLQEHHP